MYYLTSQFDTVVFVADDGDNSEPGLITYLAQLDALLADYRTTGRRAVIVGDTRYVRRPPSPVLRGLLGAWLQKNVHGVREVTVGAVFIIASPVMRGALTALGWVGALPPKTHVVPDFKQALTEAQTLLFRESLRLHPELARDDAERRALGPFLARQPRPRVRVGF